MISNFFPPKIVPYMW